MTTTIVIFHFWLSFHTAILDLIVIIITIKYYDEVKNRFT